MSCGKTDLEHVMRASVPVQGDAAAAVTVRVDQWKDLALDFRLGKRGFDEAAFPGAVVRGIPVLDGAAAADAKVLAKGFDALSACTLDLNQLSSVRVMARRGRNLDRLAAKRIGDKEAASLGKRDAIAEMADMIDDEALNHGVRR
jgi:hypothetical protein